MPNNGDFSYERLIAQLESNTDECSLTYNATETNEVVEAIYTKTKLPWYADFVNYLVVVGQHAFQPF